MNEYFTRNVRSIQTIMIILLMLTIPPVTQFTISGSQQRLIFPKKPLANKQRTICDLASQTTGDEQSLSMVWSEPLRLSENDRQGSFNPDIAVDSLGNVHTVWGDSYHPGHRIHYRRFNTHNSSWSTTQILSNASDWVFSLYPKITVDSADNIHVSWRESATLLGLGGNLLYRFFDGNNWSPTLVVAYSNMTTISHQLITDVSGTVYFVWSHDPRPNSQELFFRSYSEVTGEFSGIVQLTNGTWTSTSPFLAIDSHQQIHLVYDNKGEKYNCSEVCYLIYDGLSWQPQPATIISTDDGIRSGIPSITIDSYDNIQVVWKDSDDDYGIHYRSKTNDGWQNEQQLSVEGYAGYPTICADDFNNIHIIWSGVYDLYYKRLSNGTYWSENIAVVKQEIDPVHPVIAVDSNGTIHLIWNEYLLDYMWEIYYITGITSKNNIVLIILAVTIPTAGLIIVIVVVILIAKKKEIK